MSETPREYREIEPFRSGLLDVGDGHRIYWEQCGNPDGKHAVFLHGGPGGGCSPRHRRLFDPDRYCVTLLDQRGCGRSTPHAADDAQAALTANTTAHLVADLESLRTDLGVERWLVFGGSWGSTLALAYAQAHPHRVTELVLRGIFTLRRLELDWFYGGGAQALFPDAWAAFVDPLAAEVRTGGSVRIIEAYEQLLTGPDPEVALRAAVAWSTWEASTITLRPRPDLVEAFTEPHQALAFARIENHYMRHAGFLRDGELIEGAAALHDIPGVIVQGRYDTCTPMMTAWDLHRAWPQAQFVVVDDAGHAFDEPGILQALLAATDRFAG